MKCSIKNLLIFALPIALLAGSCKQENKLFTLLSPQQTGIDFSNNLAVNDTFNVVEFEYIYNGGGVAVGDVNNDGLPDVYFAGNMVSSQLYLNKGRMQFEDITEASGTATSVWCTGVATVDINQDGWLDIYVSIAGFGPDAKMANLLFINNGNNTDSIPTFTEMAEAYGLADEGYSTQAAFFDYDKDGDLDVYILTNALEKHNRNSVRPKRVAGEAPSTDRLYRNEGSGENGHPVFTNVSEEAGITIEGYGLGITVNDLNYDGWPDVYCANDFLSNDLVWINNQDGTFSNKAAEYLVHQTHNGMGVDIADYNNDGLVDIMVLDMLPEGNERQKMMLPGPNYDRFHMALSQGYEPQYMRNTLQLHNGFRPDGTPSFSEISQMAGVHATDWSWAPLFADFDNDGYRDLFITNGYRKDVTNLDYIFYSRQVTMMGTRAAQDSQLQALAKELPEVKINNYMYRNNGSDQDITFSDKTQEWGIDVPSFSNGAAYADFDQDGDLDLVVNNIDESAFVFRNNTVEQGNEKQPHHYLRIQLNGPEQNQNAFGTKVKLKYGNHSQYESFSVYRGYKSTVEPVLHFGLGEAAVVDSLEVVWPDGKYQVLQAIPADQKITIDYQNALEKAPASEVEFASHQPVFSEITGTNGLKYRHQEYDVVDFKQTPLLPHKHSKNGPGIAVGDVNGDGLDDFYVGGDYQYSGKLFIQQADGSFAEADFPASEDYEDMGALFFDVDQDSDPDLYVVSGGSGFSSLSRFYQDRLYINNGSGKFTLNETALPEIQTSGSCVKAADFDQDGDLDLFVGGRIVPDKYPFPARSYVLRNDTPTPLPSASPLKGETRGVSFTNVTEEVAPGLAEIGLVTDALWTDFDNDAQIDLVLTGEWMPLTFFRNEQGKLTNVTENTGLSNTQGWWNSLAAGDFDSDGDTDYIAGNLGLNSYYKASAEEPVMVYSSDFDQNGSIDPVLVHYLQGEKQVAHSREALIQQIIAMRGRFKRFIDYAEADFEHTFRQDELAGAYVVTSQTFASSYIENLGNGKFTLRALPERAQFSPIFGMLPGDFDQDGHLDLLAVGNSYASETLLGWYDASIGTFLKGDGTGNFTSVNVNKLGFYAGKDAKGLACLQQARGGFLLMITNNADSLQTFTLNAPETQQAIRLQSEDAYALLTLEDGKQRKQEFYYGDTYLSQSSRVLFVPQNTSSISIFDTNGEKRNTALSERLP